MSNSTASLIDDAPLNAFHKKLAVFSAGGLFIDGYALTISGKTLAESSGTGLSDKRFSFSAGAK